MEAGYVLLVAIGIFAILLIAGRMMNVVSDRAIAWYVCIWVALFIIVRAFEINSIWWRAIYLPLYAILLVHVKGEDPWLSAAWDFFGLTQRSKNNFRNRL